MINKLLKILSSNKDFFPPKKTKVLFIDDILVNHVQKYLKIKNFSVLDIRLNKINFFVLFKLFFSLKKKTFFNYVVEYIKLSGCKYVITFNDNLTWVYKLGKIFHSKKIYVFQNGLRDKFFHKNLKNISNPSAEIIGVFSDEIGESYKKVIDAKIICIGSVRNNIVKKIKKKRNSILFIATGCPSTKMFTGVGEGSYNIPSKLFYKQDIELAKELAIYCKKNNLKLEIASKHGTLKEFNFYNEHLKNFNYIYHKNNRNLLKSYKLSDEVFITVCSHSTLGGECLARGNRVAIFNNKKKISKGIIDVFWNLSLSSKGPFWSEKINSYEVKRVLDFTRFSKQNLWNKKSLKVTQKLVKYDPGNKSLKKIFNTIK